MKKPIYILLAVAVISVIIYFSVSVKIGGGCPPPEKPSVVPKSAAWVGGCDGGNWIELVSIEQDKVRFRIYRDWNGDLVLDADFEYQDCKEFRLNKSSWSESLAYFGNYIALMEQEGESIKCRLEPIYPAYYEEPIE